MGASGWSYFVPYQSDIDEALQELREQVFQDGRYYSREPLHISPDDFVNMPEVVQKQISFWIERGKSYKPPITIQELVAWDGEEGTHSILDIDRIADSPGFGVAAPLSTKDLRQFFGTDQPSHTMIEEKESELGDFLQEEMGRYRYEATYIVVYKDGSPDEIYFTGYSGD